MTIFAGIYARRNDGSIPITFINELRSALSRHPDDERSRIELIDDKVYLAKIDIGALGEPGHFKQENMTAFVAGDPLLQLESKLPGSRLVSLQKITTNLVNGQQDALRSCRGTYCAVAYEHARHKLYLMVDKLGVRPIYCWISPEYVVFSTALRILEAVSFCKKSLDLQGIAEIACFGYPLADRSPYENIHTLHAGEILVCGTNEFSRKPYWCWDELPESFLAEKVTDTELPKQLYQIFMDSVKIRLRKQKTVASLLSGGLDSRAIVAALKVFRVDVFAANISLPGSQDYVFSEMTAERQSITSFSHLEFRPAAEGDPYGKAAVRDWLNSAEFLARHPQQPSVVWSGDGGSLGLGHIYLNSDIIRASREKDLQKATMLFMKYNRWGITPKLLKPYLAIMLNELVDKGMKAELNSRHPKDDGRIFYLFLLLNDQRRHMFNHFENMDLARIEFEMPFFDADFITSIVRQPIDAFLYHRFYLDWLRNFPSQLGILDVPWQAYPNHVPCPLPQPSGLTYQWNKTFTPKQTKEKQLAASKKAKTLLNDLSFSEKHLSKVYVYLFMLMNFGRTDRSYLLHVPTILHRYWSRSN